MGLLRERLSGPVAPVESCGWDGDALEAQAFAYLAVRSLKGLALSLPGTTGVKAPTTGGKLHRAGAAKHLIQREPGLSARRGGSAPPST